MIINVKFKRTIVFSMSSKSKVKIKTRDDGIDIYKSKWNKNDINNNSMNFREIEVDIMKFIKIICIKHLGY